MKNIKRVRLTALGKKVVTYTLFVALMVGVTATAWTITDIGKADAVTVHLDSLDGVEYVSLNALAQGYPDLKIKHNEPYTTLKAKDFELIADSSSIDVVTINGKEVGLHNPIRMINKHVYIDYKEFADLIKGSSLEDFSVNTVESYKYDVNRLAPVNIYEDEYYNDKEYGDNLPQAVLKHGSPEEVEEVVIEGVVYKKAKLVRVEEK